VNSYSEPIRGLKAHMEVWNTLHARARPLLAFFKCEEHVHYWHSSSARSRHYSKLYSSLPASLHPSQSTQDAGTTPLMMMRLANVLVCGGNHSVFSSLSLSFLSRQPWGRAARAFSSIRITIRPGCRSDCPRLGVREGVVRPPTTWNARCPRTQRLGTSSQHPIPL
jgi:hypothetical protein